MHPYVLNVPDSPSVSASRTLGSQDTWSDLDDELVDENYVCEGGEEEEIENDDEVIVLE